jgi:hypothetical protein
MGGDLHKNGYFHPFLLVGDLAIVFENWPSFFPNFPMLGYASLPLLTPKRKFVRVSVAVLGYQSYVHQPHITPIPPCVM